MSSSRDNTILSSLGLQILIWRLAWETGLEHFERPHLAILDPHFEQPREDTRMIPCAWPTMLEHKPETVRLGLYRLLALHYHYHHHLFTVTTRLASNAHEPATIPTTNDDMLLHHPVHNFHVGRRHPSAALQSELQGP